MVGTEVVCGTETIEVGNTSLTVILPPDGKIDWLNPSKSAGDVDSIFTQFYDRNNDACPVKNIKAYTDDTFETEWPPKNLENVTMEVESDADGFPNKVKFQFANSSSPSNQTVYFKGISEAGRSASTAITF